MHCFGQQKQFDINWNRSIVLETAYNKIEVPSFDTNHFDYNEDVGLTFFTQWDSNGVQIDENSVSLTNVVYETISKSELKSLNVELVPSSPEYKLYNTNARGKKGHYFELSPIIKDRSGYKKITAFTINYNVFSGFWNNVVMGVNEVTNSV